MSFRKHRKQNLLSGILNSFREDGWRVLILNDTKYHPFILRIAKNDESYTIRIYIWNLTHGGGAARPTDEYRIQVTGVDRFENQPDGRTLILGYWENENVYAGFDFNMHNGVLGASPSIQIRDNALKLANTNGYAPHRRENDEIAIAFRPDFFGEYVRSLDQLHSFGQSERDYEILEKVAQDPNQVNDQEIEYVAVERKTVVYNVRKKLRDNSFKKRIQVAYSCKCAFCGIQLKLIDAAHIIPVEAAGNDATNNGIALCALHHRAYDKNLVTFTDNYKNVLNTETIGVLVQSGFGDGFDFFTQNLKSTIHLPTNVDDRPLVQNVIKANEIRGWNLS